MLFQQPIENNNKEFNTIKKSQLVNIKQLDVVSNTSSAMIDKSTVAIKRTNRLLSQKVKESSYMYEHSNIVRFLGTSDEDESQFFLIMPFANDGNLRSYIRNNSLSFNEKVNIEIDIANGIMFLHMKDIVHGNLNPKNILIFDGVAKISNLPLPYNNKDLYFKNKELYFDSNLFDNIGYIDPNSLLNRNYEKIKSVDIYSFGTLLWEIMSEKVPYSQYQNDIIRLIRKIKEGYREDDISDVPAGYIDLYKKCWDEDSSKRPSICDILNILLDMK